MNTINGNFLERTIPSLKGTLVTLNIGNSTFEMNLEDFKALMAPEPTPIPEASYKVYTALLTQNGESDSQTQTSGELTYGRTYYISATDGGTVDFTNVGAPNNDEGTSFIATANANPNSWGENGNGSLNFNTGVPIVTILENTIGNVWFEYNDVGNYIMASNSLFMENKTVSLNDQTRCIDSGNNIYALRFTVSGENAIYLETLDDEFAPRNGRLTNKLIEIRVYN